MRIARLDIQNFRKLKCTKIEIHPEQTLFVGANNSGKTSAMDALICFLRKDKNRLITTTDFTLSNWPQINKLGQDCLDAPIGESAISTWKKLVPSIDVWIEVEDTDLHYISHLIPTLDWDGKILGVRFILEPTNLLNLHKDFKTDYQAAEKANELRKKGKAPLNLWPCSLREFLDKKLHSYFKVNAYILDPSKYSDESIQTLLDSEPLESDPFEGLFKIDIINAQRGFSDATSDEGSNTDKRLSTQLRKYYDRHLDPNHLPEASDLDALAAIEEAKAMFDENLQKRFKPTLYELQGLNYPGFNNPQINLSSKITPIETLTHESAVQFGITSTNGDDSSILYLPEKYNGLGYRNLISMIFSLIRFRDEWMKVGKAINREPEDGSFQPLHLVLIEEPEAHLHAQIQQVFIKKAFAVLRDNEKLRASTNLTTQLIVSTHSSDIAHEVNFDSLRYFKRILKNPSEIPFVEVINLTEIFGSQESTSKFAIRYLKATHCDLFFADAAILVEGAAERILIPHFIKSRFAVLDQSYISLLEIGGSHAYRLKPLIENLGLLTLVVTDLDSIDKSGKKTRPIKGQSQKTANNTLKNWKPQKVDLDDLLSSENIQSNTTPTCIVYPKEVTAALSGSEEGTAIPYTFEDALVLANIDFFKNMQDSTGLLQRMNIAVNSDNLIQACQSMFDALKNGKKAEMALDLLYTTDPDMLVPPQYINQGLEWLEESLKPQADPAFNGVA